MKFIRANNLESAISAQSSGSAPKCSAYPRKEHLPTPPSPHGRGAPISATTASTRAFVSRSLHTTVTTSTCRLVRAKASGYYINSILANQEATTDGYDEALLLDTEGFVSEGSGENVFIVKNGKLYTPDLASCLDGITRDTVITLANDLGFEVIQKRITRDEVYCADEAFFSGTAAEITPIRELDNRQIGSGSRGRSPKKSSRSFSTSSPEEPEIRTLVKSGLIRFSITKKSANSHLRFFYYNSFFYRILPSRLMPSRITSGVAFV